MQINLDHNKKYLLACSYGPDSMALFSLLLKGNYNFVVAHINYGL
ncbi:MAG TPA: ATP-binding protein, partial [Bacilli bacterium]|nr:ATP-binding protein [Bacilli bacterium]